jgi:hypothetical protein
MEESLMLGKGVGKQRRDAVRQSDDAAYQQALEDFAIVNLLARIQNNYWKEQETQPITTPESELIAGLLVEHLSNSIDSQLVSAYLNAMRQGSLEVLPEPLSLEYPQQTNLPANFPTSGRSPRYSEGQILRLVPINIERDQETLTDFGCCIGRYYGYAPHQCHWMWKYVLWLDKDSLSASWCVATTAWEDELEPVNTREVA